MRASFAGPAAFVLAGLSFAACGDPPAAQPSAHAGSPPAAEPAAPPARTYAFTYEARVPVPEGTRRLRVWAPLPRDEDGVQRVRSLRIEAPAGARETRTRDFANRLLHAEITDPALLARREIPLAWTAVIERRADVGQGRGDVLERYRTADRLVPIDGAAREVARRLGVLDPALDPAAAARRIFEDVLDGMAYDKLEPGWGEGDFTRALTVCKGNCTDFHARFIGVGRAAGLAVRFTMGIPLAPGRSSYDSYHCWAHWFDAASGTWKPVDVSEADKIAEKDPEGAARFFGWLDPDRLTLTYGRDLVLDPPQDAPPLNYLVFPYAEADGTPVAMDKSLWTFRWTDR